MEATFKGIEASVTEQAGKLPQIINEILSVGNPGLLIDCWQPLMHNWQKKNLFQDFNNDIYDKILNDLDEIQKVHKDLGSEVKKQSKSIDEIGSLNETSETIISSNNIKAKRILRKL